MTLEKAKARAQHCLAQTGQTFFVVWDNSLGDSDGESYYVCTGIDLDTFFADRKPVFATN